MTVHFYEGDAVSYTGTAMPPARGKLLYFASDQAAHVKWVEGAHAGDIDLIDLWDLTPVTSAVAMAEVDPMSYTACRRAMEYSGPEGVLNFLVTAKQVDGWEKIAREILVIVEERLRYDASMELPSEQLSGDQFSQVVSLASRVLLRDAFGELPT